MEVRTKSHTGGLRVLALPGGATKGAGIAGSAVTACVEYDYQPDIITGVSFGAMAAVPLALGKYSELIGESKKATLRKIFTKSPVTQKGKLHPMALLRALFGAESLGVQDIREIMWKVIKPEEHYEYITGPYADCYIMAVDYRSRKPVIVNLRDRAMNYSEFLYWVQASALIPIAAQGQRIPKTKLNFGEDGLATYKEGKPLKGRLFYDGGLVDHNAGVRVCELLESRGEKIDQLVSIYPRPENFEIPELPEPKNIIDVALGTIDIQKVENSIEDQKNEVQFKIQKEAKGENFKLHQIFLPWILESVYDVDPQRLEQLQEESIIATREALDANPL